MTVYRRDGGKAVRGVRCAHELVGGLRGARPTECWTVNYAETPRESPRATTTKRKPRVPHEGSESPNPEQPSGDGSPQPGITVTLQDGQRITPGRAQHREDDPGSDSPDEDSDSDDDNSDSEDGGTIHVAPPDYHSMSARELRYHARVRGLTGSFHQGRGNRRAALIDFLEDGSLTNLPGCHVRSRR